jgi:hypothetical protein
VIVGQLSIDKDFLHVNDIQQPQAQFWYFGFIQAIGRSPVNPLLRPGLAVEI